MSLRSGSIALLLILCVPALAGAEGPTKGIYLGASANAAFDNFGNDRGVDVGPGFGAGLRAGSRLNENFAIETQWEWTGRLEDDSVTSIVGAEDVTAEGHVITANAKYFPLPGRIEPLVFAGMGVGVAEADATVFGMSDDNEEAAFTMRFGAGVQGAITDSVSVLLESSYVLPTGKLEDFQYISVNLGVTVHFDGFEGP